MRSQLDDESDDEYFDDPIKLFDLEQERVHYGSQSTLHGNSSNEGFCQSKSNFTSKSDAVFLELPSNDSDGLCVSDCLPLSVKLVDCNKFPWYFKKYTQQILNKANFYDLVSDSENEVDVEHVSNNNDYCVISGNINSEFKHKNKYTKNFSPEKLPTVIQKTKAEKRLEKIKLREDFEIQIALYKKNMEEIDFKRNKGLIGMTVTQKVLKNVGLDVTIHRNIKIKHKSMKQNEPDQSYIRAAEKILSDVGTELLHVCENTEKPVTTEEIGTDDNRNLRNEIYKYGELRSKKLFNSPKISKSILHRITTNKSSDKIQHGNQDRITCSNTTQEIKLGLNLDTSLELSSSKIEVKSSSKPVENIKKTNKYKNSHIKAIEKMILEKEALELNKKKIGTDNAIILGRDTNSTKSPQKTVEADICEPNSPILHCSTLAKKNKEVNEVSKSGTTTKTNNFGYLVDKQKSTDNFNGSENKSKTSHQVNDNNLMPELTRELQKTCIKLHHKNEETGQVTEVRETTEGAIENNNETCNDILTKYNQNPVVENLIPTSQGNCNDLSIQIISVESIATSSKTTNANVASIDKTTPPPDDESTIQNKPVSAINDHNGISHYNNGVKPNSSIENDSVEGPMVNDSRCSPNITNVYNPYASAIILKSKQSSISQNRARYSQPIFNEPPRISGPNQPRFYQNSYSKNYLTPPPHFSIDQRFIPRSVNSAIPNFRFPPPHGNRHQTAYNPVQGPSFFDGRRHLNIFPKKASRGAWSRKSLPCRFPVKIMPKALYKTRGAFGTEFGDFFFPENNPQQQSNPQPDNITQSKNILEPKILPQPKNTIQPYNIPQPNNIFQPENTPQSKDIHKPNNILQPKNISQPSNISQANNVLQPANCSVIGSNNAGLVKKIKIDSKFLSQDIEKQLDKINSNNGVLELKNGNVELITSKNSMLEILDSATNNLKRAGTDIIEVDKKSVQPFKRPKVANKLQITPNDDNCKKKQRQKGYSDPILPIPTYEKMMGRVISDLQEKEEPRNNSVCHRNLGNDKKYNEKWHKRALSHKPNGTARKEDIKKISLEEYKKRTAKNTHKTECSNKKVCDKKNTYDRKLLNGQNKFKSNVDRIGMESDLGYDSDSTVIL